MPIITFWSNNEKTIGQSVSVATAATVMAIEHTYKVLLISVDFNNDVIERSFGAQDSNKEILKSIVSNQQMNLDSGINGLLKLVDSKRISPEIIHDYTKIVFKNRLEVLYSPMSIFTESQMVEQMEKMKSIIVNAAKYYDYVFVDLKKGLKCSTQLDILNISDIIVANINQDIKAIGTLLNIKELNKMNNKVIWNICKYDKKSKYNVKNLSRTILKKQIITNIDYNTLLLDAIQDGGISELLLKLRTLKNEDENREFIESIKQLNEKILLKYQEMRMRM